MNEKIEYLLEYYGSSEEITVDDLNFDGLTIEDVFCYLYFVNNQRNYYKSLYNNCMSFIKNKGLKGVDVNIYDDEDE